MEYLCSRITAKHWTAKSNAHRQLLKDVVDKMDRRVFSEESHYQDFIKEFRELVDKVNLENPRAKDYKLSIWKIGRDSEEISISVPGVFNMELFKVKRMQL